MVKESEIVKKKLMARVDSLESDRRFLYQQEKALDKKCQELEETSVEFKVDRLDLLPLHCSPSPTLIPWTRGTWMIHGSDLPPPPIFLSSFIACLHNRLHPMRLSGAFAKKLWS